MTVRRRAITTAVRKRSLTKCAASGTRAVGRHIGADGRRGMATERTLGRANASFPVTRGGGDEDRTIDDHGHILIVDDDQQIRLLVARFLQRHGYRVTGAPDGHAMREALRSAPMDLIVLDLMLPNSSGLDLCREVRAVSAVPIIMLTARSDETDRIVGLEMGADDYLGKPFSPRELLARIRAVLRRARSRADHGLSAEAGVKYFEGWRLDLRRRELTSPANVLVDLSTGEFDLLVALVDHPNRVLSREALMELAKTRSADPFDRTIDVQISCLRRKLEADENGSQLIKTVRGAGYMFAPSVERAT